MNILFFLEPAIELANPEFRYATLRSAIAPQIVSLRNAGVTVHTIVSEVIAERAIRDGNLSALGTVSTIDPIEWTQGENTLERALRHQKKQFLDGEIERLATLLNHDLPENFQPDIVMIWESPASFMSAVFPHARILYQMPGFFSRAPFASLVSFETELLQANLIAARESLESKDAQALHDLRVQHLRFFDVVTPPLSRLQELKNSYTKIVLFPLQIDGYFMIDSVLGRRNQFDVLIEVLANAPNQCAVVVTNYVSGNTKSSVLSQENVKYLRSRFPNFVYDDNLDNIPSVSQLLVPQVDGVITISSSIGYQAAFWQKPLMTIGESHISTFRSSISWQEFYQQVKIGMPICRDAMICATLRTRHLPSDLLAQNGGLYARWLKEILHNNINDFPKWTENPLGEVLNDLRRESEYLKQLGFSKRVKEESSMDHCCELSQQMVRYDVISFDIFDTLLLRPFKSPADMFELMSGEVRSLCNIPSLDFKTARRLAEKSSFVAAIARGQGETNIDEIYETFAIQNSLPDRIAEQVKDLEMKMEMEILYPRRTGLKAFNEALSLGKKIILISDMYLSKDFVKAVLKKNGYERYEHLYVSSAARVKKHNGKLFDLVLEELKLEPGKILHIGDNLKADVIQAKERGIKPFHLVKSADVFGGSDSYQRVWKRDEERHSPDWKIILAVIGNRFHDNPYLPHLQGSLFRGDPWRLGYYGQGPLLLGFAKWLMEKAIRDGVQRLYFLSRDGLIMKEAYDRISKNHPEAPSSHYLLCSRRAVNLAKVRNEGDVLDLLHVDFAHTSIEYFLASRFGVFAKDIPQKILADHNLTLSSTITNKQIEALKPFFQDLLPQIISAAAKERSNYLEYLQTTDLLGNGKVSLVDIGYAGTMQESLYLLTNKVKNFGGYYLITFRQALQRVDAYGMPIRGYLGEFVDRHDTHHPFCKNVPLYETFFSSADTSFVRMERDWKQRLTPVFMDRFPAESRREAVIKQVHQGALAFIEEVVSLLGTRLLMLDIEPVKSSRVLEHFFTAPCPIDAQILSGVVFEDAYGGAGLKTILPLNNELDKICVWKKGAEVMQAFTKTTPSMTNIDTAPHQYSALAWKSPGIKVFNKIEHRIIRWIVTKTSTERKFRKFEAIPHKFFADSKARHVRFLGKVYMARSH